MTITNEPLVPGQAVQFKLTGFPEETAIKSSLERFYAKAPHADKKFNISNAFDELIISGRVDELGKIMEYVSHPRPEKNFPANK